MKVRQAILVEAERVFGEESKEAGEALFNLGKRVPSTSATMPSNATCWSGRCQSSSASTVATVRKWLGLLNNLGNAYVSLGDYAKARDMLRALACDHGAGQEHGCDHAEVAVTLTNLGNAYGSLGDHAKACGNGSGARAHNQGADVLGRDHLEVAITLTNLGNAYGTLGDHAKKRDILERALAIDERAYGRDHPEVAQTLTNLGNAYGALGDTAKQRDMLMRARDQRARVRQRQHASGHDADEPRERVLFPWRLRQARETYRSGRSRSRSGRMAATTRKWPRRWGTSGAHTACLETTQRRETSWNARSRSTSGPTAATTRTWPSR